MSARAVLLPLPGPAAAWNAATYVAQIDDARLAQAMSSATYLDATRAVLRKHGELWFNDESYLITRRDQAA